MITHTYIDTYITHTHIVIIITITLVITMILIIMRIIVIVVIVVVVEVVEVEEVEVEVEVEVYIPEARRRDFQPRRNEDGDQRHMNGVVAKHNKTITIMIC